MSFEFDEQLSLLQKPDKDEMDPEYFEMLEKATDEQMENWGYINNLFKILPLNPSEHLGFLAFKKSLFDPETTYLPEFEKEMIGIVVSSVNKCAYCLATHSDYLRGMTGDPQWVDQLAHNWRECYHLTDRQRAMCEYAEFVTRHIAEINAAEQVEKLRAAGMDDHQILECAYVAGFFNYTNRWVGTIKAMPNLGHYQHNR